MILATLEQETEATIGGETFAAAAEVGHVSLCSPPGAAQFIRLHVHDADPAGGDALYRWKPATEQFDAENPAHLDVTHATYWEPE